MTFSSKEMLDLSLSYSRLILKIEHFLVIFTPPAYYKLSAKLLHDFKATVPMKSRVRCRYAFHLKTKSLFAKYLSQ